MATQVAQIIVRKLLAASVIPEDDKELYEYGFFLLVSKVSFFIITFITGTLMGIPLEATVFFLSFMLIRGYAGGIHAPSEFLCLLFTSLAILFSLVLIKFATIWILAIPNMMVLIGACICIYVFSPVDTEEKPLEESECRQYRKITRLILFGYILGMATTAYLCMYSVSYAIMVSLFVECILLILGRISRCVNRK